MNFSNTRNIFIKVLTCIELCVIVFIEKQMLPEKNRKKRKKKTKMKTTTKTKTTAQIIPLQKRGSRNSTKIQASPDILASKSRVLAESAAIPAMPEAPEIPEATEIAPA